MDYRVKLVPVIESQYINIYRPSKRMTEYSESFNVKYNIPKCQMQSYTFFFDSVEIRLKEMIEFSGN